MKKHWKKEEIDYLHSNLNKKTVSDIAIDLGRSEMSLNLFMYRHKIAKKTRIPIARLEADNFAFLVKKSKIDPEEILSKLKRIVSVHTKGMNINLRMGIYEVVDKTIELRLMCDRAKMALRSTKGIFSENIGYYDEKIREKIIEEHALVGEMENAIENGQFEVYFPPQYNYLSSMVIGAEALVRWKHPERGLLSPVVFFSLFENNGFTIGRAHT